MDIVIIADFCGRFNQKDNGRFTYLAQLLCERHSVEIITSDFKHGEKKYFEFTPSDFPYKITMLHEGYYKKNVCFQRFRAHYIWGKNVSRYLDSRKKPDVIYCAIPTLQAAYEAAKYCEKNEVRFIVDIQDLWPEAFEMSFHVPLLSPIVFAPFQYLANAIYKRADEICAVSQSYVNRALLVNRKCKIGHSVFLGTSLKRFDENVRNNSSMKKDVDELWLAYCGTLGKSYDIEGVIEALDLLKNEKIKVPRFIVIGDGEKMDSLKELAKQKKVDAYFVGRLKYGEMCSLLCKCDMVVNPIISTSVASIINKHGDYAASGLPVLNTQNSIEYINLVEKYKMGLNSKPGDVTGLAKNIRTLVQDENIRLMMGRHARKCAIEKFDRDTTYIELIETICVTKSEEEKIEHDKVES